MKPASASWGPPCWTALSTARVAERTGNRDPYMAPHGAYPCLGNDRWIAIAVRLR